MPLPLAVLAASLLAPPTDPTPRAYTLAWDAPAACPSADAVTAQIDTLLEDRPTHTGASVRSRVSAIADARWRLELDIVVPGAPEADRTRVIEDADCRLVADAAVLVTAIALERSEPEPAPAPMLRTPPPAQPKRPPPQLRLRVLAGAAVGATPRIAGIVGGAVGIGLQRFALDLEALHHIARTSHSTADHAVVVATTRASLLACGIGRVGRWSFEPCAAIHAGAMRGSGRGFDITRRPVDLWLAIGARAQIAVRVRDPLHVWWAGDVALAVRRPGFADHEGVLLYRAQQVAADVLAGLGVTLPLRRR